MISSPASCLSSVNDQSAAALLSTFSLLFHTCQLWPLPLLCIFPGLCVEILDFTVRVSRV